MPLTDRLAWICDSLRDRLWLRRRLKIRSSDYVLDVGSGAGPNLRANVLCDKYVDDGTERMGQPLRSDRPCIVGDVERLPFADNSFDFVICSHVLEHVSNPDLSIAELQRVAARGYIETPNGSWEKVQGYPFHRWLVSLEGDQLCFHEKPGPAWDPDLSRWFNELQDSLAIRRRIWFARRRVGVFTSLVWDGAIKYRILASEAPTSGLQSASTEGHVLTQAPAGGRLGAGTLEDWVTRLLRRRSDRPWSFVESLLRCPDCAERLDATDGTYLCVGCGTRFPVDDAGRPLLLPSASSRVQVGEPARP